MGSTNQSASNAPTPQPPFSLLRSPAPFVTSVIPAATLKLNNGSSGRWLSVRQHFSSPDMAQGTTGSPRSDNSKCATYSSPPPAIIGPLRGPRAPISGAGPAEPLIRAGVDEALKSRCLIRRSSRVRGSPAGHSRSTAISLFTAQVL